ncbi:MAG TPA: hypothetical protein VIR76_03405 [Pusillimonas sp.]
MDKRPLNPPGREQVKVVVMGLSEAKRAKRPSPRFLALIEQFARSPAGALANTLTSWLPDLD